MKELLSNSKHAYHLSEYLILENEDGAYEYMTWQPDEKTKKLSWIRGEAEILGDVLGLTRITSEGVEESMETPLEVNYEFDQLPKWDKTKYYCVIMLGQNAGILCYSETGSRVDENGEDYKTAGDILKEQGVVLLFEGAMGFESSQSHLA